MSRLFWKRTVKFIHSLAAIGMLGAIGVHLILLIHAPVDDLQAYAALRAAIGVITKWVLLPSLGLVLVSGLLSMAVHQPFQEQRWVWVKALLGISVFEGTLGAIQATSQRAVGLSAKVAAGEAESAAMAQLLRHEWLGLWAIMVLAIANVALATWRPSLRRRRGQRS